MKHFIVKVRSTYSHGCYGKEVFRQLEVEASTKKEAIEKVKQDMFKVTYFDFFPQFKNYEENHSSFNMYSIRKVLKTSTFIGFNQYGCPMYNYATDDELNEQCKSLITNDIFERVEIVAVSRR